MSQQGYNIDSLFQEAQSRWLKPAEVLYILQNHEKYQFTQKPLERPTSGSLFLFNKRILRFFRRDGHNWRKKKDGRTVGEAHERLKVGNVEALNCYYAHGEENPNFQRRSYWMLDLDYEHIVLVHYREITEGRASPGSVTVLSPGASSTLSPSPRSYTPNYPSASSGTSDLHEPCQTLSSPASVEVSSEKVSEPNGEDGRGKVAGSTDLEVTLRRLEEQLSLNEESLKDVGPFSFQETEIDGSGLLEDGRGLTKQNHFAELLPQTEEYAINDQFYSGFAGMQDPSNNFVLLQDAGNAGEHPHQSYSFGCTDGSKESLCWNELLETSRTSSIAKFQEEQISSSRRELADEQEYYQWPDFNGASDRNFKAPMLLPQEEENFKIDALSSTMENHETSSGYYPMLFDQGSIPLEVGSRVTIAQKQRFTIQAISPEWGYTNETTKVIVVGSFHCDPAESTWTCMFGDIEVPIQIIQDGVIRCEAPPHPPGKVTLCITTGNRESCSEVREFEYRGMTTSCTHCNFSQTEATKSPEELLLLVRFVQMLLSDSSKQNIDSLEPRKHGELKADDDMWGHIIEALLFGNGSTSGTVDWLMQELLKDKLLQWLASRTQEGCQQETQAGCQQEVCLLSKNEQGIMHMAAGLGYEWALNPILSHGVGINFRDISGWTALHWAARFGREKMVAALIASGASAGAVTDPTSQDLTGKTPASIAAINGHKGLAGYLSEVDLTSHLSSLTLEESELSKGPAADQADMTVNSVSKGYLGACEDQTSLKDTLAAVRNATQAAARIQSAFRAHSFRIRQQRNAAGSIDVYGVNENDIQGLAAMSKLTFGDARDYNSAALSIQKKYRGWKGRNDFLALRQKVVKIQAHVRGYQVRKQYKVICWAVGVLDKVILRWRRKGVGLRGFRKETVPINESEDDEDILKVFRKQKVDAAVDEAVSRVLSMVKSPDARQQYHRMLEGYRQAKAEIDNTASSSHLSDMSDMEKDLYNYLQEQLPVTLSYSSR